MSYTFDAQATLDDDAQRLQYKFIEDNGIPRKLGDGTYGSVFQALGPGNEIYAVKLFYPVDEGDPTFKRNRAEMQSKIRVVSALEKEHMPTLKSNLVLAEAWTESFLSSPAYKALKKQFEAIGVAVSNYALVMPYYECTLKDVLEGGAPVGRQVGGEIISEQGVPGYEILRRLTVANRERRIIGIVSQIVTGLLALHVAKLHHHDIKPANIMMTTSGPNVDVALGDFGFLEADVGGTGKGYATGLPFGTRHYRSPEQKDFFDVCDVKVMLASTKRKLVLETDDRKFHDSLIEAGDIAEFSKDKDKVGYPVTDVELMKDGKSKIYLAPQKENEPEDQRTQVLFYKKPSPRTDIFGIGAILFDLLTVGRSPECFYDYLRPFDRSNSDDGASVNLIIERYRAAASANSTSADLAPLFDQIRDNEQGRFPSPEIVSILFRCMLSRAKDSYYAGALSGDGVIDRKALFAAVRKDITEFWGDDTHTVMPATNPIWEGKVREVSISEVTSTFVGELMRVREIPVGKRMVWGALRLRQLVQMVERIRMQDTFFVDLSPANLRFDKNNTEIAAVIESYKSEEDYLQAVRSGSAWRMEGLSDTDNYVPIYRRFNVRSVDVDVVDESGLEGRQTVKVRHTQSLPIWRGTKSGDLLRTVDYFGSSRLYQIGKTEKQGAWNKLEIMEIDVTQQDEVNSEAQDKGDHDEGSDGSLGRVGERTRGMLIRRLNPMGYYMSILATYIHHLFFADEKYDNGTVPDVMWSVLQRGISGGLVFRRDRVSRLSAVRNILGRSKPPDIESVKSLLARIYLELNLLAEGGDTQVGSAADMQAKLLEVCLELDDAVAGLCGVGDGNRLRATPVRELEVLGMKVVDLAGGEAFSHYLRSHVDVDGRGM